LLMSLTTCWQANLLNPKLLTSECHDGAMTGSNLTRPSRAEGQL
jgi:hypothetical protein